MTRRDAVWRMGGSLLSVGGCVSAFALDHSPPTVVFLPIVIAGLTMIINGKRIGILLQAERRGHWHTAEVIHAQRRRRSRSTTGQGGRDGCSPAG